MAKTKITEKDSGKLRLQKVEKPKPREVDAAMIIETINEIASNLEDCKGAALASIKNSIAREHGFRVGKARQALIREIMIQEFNAGRFTMTNHNGPKINFNKRFDVFHEDEEDDDAIQK